MRARIRPRSLAGVAAHAGNVRHPLDHLSGRRVDDIEHAVPLGISPPAVDVHALGDRDHGLPPLRKVACRDTQTRLGRRPWATIEWMLDPLIRPRRSGRIGAMALPSSALWQGRPMTENRVCVARWRETGGASA